MPFSNNHPFPSWDEVKNTDWWSEDNITRLTTSQSESSSQDCWKDVGKNVAQMDVRYEATFRDWLRKEENLNAIVNFLQRIANEYPLDRIINALRCAGPFGTPAQGCQHINHHHPQPSPGLTSPLANAAGPTINSMTSSGASSKNANGNDANQSKRDRFLPSPFNVVPSVVTPSMLEGEVRRAVLIRELTQDWSCSKIAYLITKLSQQFWGQRQLQETFLRNLVSGWNFCRLSEFFSHVGGHLGLDYKVKVDMLQQAARAGALSAPKPTVRARSEKRRAISKENSDAKRRRANAGPSRETVSVAPSVSTASSSTSVPTSTGSNNDNTASTAVLSTESRESTCNLNPAKSSESAMPTTTATAPASPTIATINASVDLASQQSTATRESTTPALSRSAQINTTPQTSAPTSSSMWQSEQRAVQTLRPNPRGRGRHSQRPSLISSTFALPNSTNISSTSSTTHSSNANVPSSSPATATRFNLTSSPESSGATNASSPNSQRNTCHQAISSTVNSPSASIISRPRTTSESECVQFESMPPSSLSHLIRATGTVAVPVVPSSQLSFSVLPPRSVPMSTVCNNNDDNNNNQSNSAEQSGQMDSSAVTHTVTNNPTTTATSSDTNQTRFDVLGIRVSSDSLETNN